MAKKPQYNNETLIENIKRRCSVPTSQLTYTEEDFVLLANDELQGEVVPLIMSTRDEYFVDYIDVNVDSTAIIPIPPQAVGAKLRSVCYVIQNVPLTLVNLPLFNLDTVAGINNGGLVTRGFYIQDNSIHLYPNTSIPENSLIRVYYYRRSLMLAEPSEYGQIISIDAGSDTIVLDKVPTSLEIGDTINAISSEPNFKITKLTASVVNISSPSVVLDSVTGLSVGDYISLEGFSAVPQIPVEAHAYLAQLTAAKALEGLGDMEGMAAALKKAETLKSNLLIMTSQRVDGSNKKIINPNGGLRTASTINRFRRNR